jgi:putative transposase
MPRNARITAPGLTYHVTHRGNRGAEVFFTREDRDTYLQWLSRAAEHHGLEIWAYCLMTNHVHLLVRGIQVHALGRAMQEIQGRYARRVNWRNNWSGHLWANRFFSCPVEGEHLWAAVRYIERNPVRAGLVVRAQLYRWSSARAHCGLAGPGILSPMRPFPGHIEDWSTWLETGDEARDKELRDACRTGRPAGSQAFRARLEQEVGHSLLPRPRGRPRKTEIGACPHF